MLSSDKLESGITVSKPLPTRLYQHGNAAFADFLDESIGSALLRAYRPMGFLAAIKDGFYNDGKFSKKTAGILVASLTIATIAGYFYINPSSNAADTIITFLGDATGYDFSGSDALVYLMQSTSTGENIFVSTYSAMLMFQTYANRPSKAAQFLHFHDATLPEKFRNFGRKIFDLLCAACANIPTFLLTKSISLPLAILTALANVCLSWKGVSNFSFRLSMLPVRRELINYLETQMNHFLTSSEDDKQDIINRLMTITNDKNHSKLFYHLLNLCESALDKKEANKIYIQKPDRRRVLHYGIALVTGLMGFAAELAFIATTAITVPTFFSDPDSPESWATTLTLVALSLLPAAGFGFKGGFNAGFDSTARTPALPHYAMPITHTISLWMIRIITLFSGGASFAIAYNTTETFAQAQNFSQMLEDVCKYTFACAAYTGSTIMNGYYTSCLADEIKTYFGLRCSDQKTNKLFDFVLAMRQLQSILTSMTDEALIDCLQNMMLLSDTAIDDEGALSNLLYAIFYNGMSKKEYAAFYKEVQECQKHEANANKKPLKNRSEITPPEVVHRFFSKKEKQPVKNGGQKREWCWGIFAKKSHALNHDASLAELPQWAHFANSN